MSDLARKLIAQNKKTRDPFLDLGNCSLSKIPEEINQLSWLRSQNLASEWRESEDGVWLYKRSQNPGRPNKRLADLSPLSGLTALQSLTVSDTLIADLSPLSGLTALQSLYVAETLVADLNPLSGLSALQSLDVSRTQVADLSPLSGLTALQSLNVSRTKVAGLRPLTCLTALQSLDASETQVAGLRPLSGLTALQSLNVSRTKVASLRPLSGLTVLQRLDVPNTQVTDLTPLRDRISRGLPVRWNIDPWRGPGIYVEDCPLQIPPPEIVWRGSKAILNYFRERDAGGVDHLYEAKMLILGEGGTGKTSLLRRLYQPEQTLPGEKDTTKGIDIHRQEFDLPGGRRFRLNVWDFGGQEIYHATHQFFLTHRSLYLLLDDSRKDHKSVTDEGFKYWLELIDTFGGHSPVLIFQNQKGGRSKTVDLAGIKGRFDNVKDFYAGNLELSDAADALREAIEFQASHLSHIGEELPARWIKVREYYDLYARHLPADRVKALFLSRYLRDPELAWLSGVLFERDGSAVRVELLPTGREIEMRARGSEAKALLSVIAADLDALNEGFPGLREKVDTWIPCNCPICRKATVPEFFAEKELRKRKADGRLRKECPRSCADVEVLELLDGVRMAKQPAWAKEVKTPALRTLRLFLASSAELREDRDAFDLYVRHQNDRLKDQGIYLQVDRWEHFLDAMSETRLQDEYNKAVRESDLFVSLFFTKAGQFTQEEFDHAYGQFLNSGKPRIYTYFKTAEVSMGKLGKEVVSLLTFKDKLQALGHYPTDYENIESLKNKFREQLDWLLDSGV